MLIKSQACLSEAICVYLQIGQCVPLVVLVSILYMVHCMTTNIKIKSHML